MAKGLKLIVCAPLVIPTEGRDQSKIRCLPPLQRLFPFLKKPAAALKGMITILNHVFLSFPDSLRQKDRRRLAGTDQHEESG